MLGYDCVESLLQIKHIGDTLFFAYELLLKQFVEESVKQKLIQVSVDVYKPGVQIIVEIAFDLF